MAAGKPTLSRSSRTPAEPPDSHSSAPRFCLACWAMKRLLKNTSESTIGDSDVLLFGIGSSFLADVEAMLDRLAISVAAYVANVDDPPALTRSTIEASDIPQRLFGLPCVIPLTTPGHRQTIVAEIDQLGILHRPPLIDPTAHVARSTNVEEGVIVNVGTVIGGEAHLGRFCTVNRASSIGHHSTVEPFAAIGPGVTIPASVTIETGAFIGTGAVLMPNSRIGRNAIVGAGAVVVRDVEPHTVVVGNPARVIRRDIVGYNDVSVR